MPVRPALIGGRGFSSRSGLPSLYAMRGMISLGLWWLRQCLSIQPSGQLKRHDAVTGVRFNMRLHGPGSQLQVVFERHWGPFFRVFLCNITRLSPPRKTMTRSLEQTTGTLRRQHLGARKLKPRIWKLSSPSTVTFLAAYTEAHLGVRLVQVKEL